MGTRSNRDDDLPSCMSVLDVSHCGGNLAQRKSAVNHRSHEFRIRTEAASGELPEYFVTGTEPGDVPADCFDVAGDVGADDPELGCAKPGDETKWKWRPAQQMPIACIRGRCANSHQHVVITNGR